MLINKQLEMEFYAIEQERIAFERRQTAYINFLKGHNAEADLAEIEAAQTEWVVANAVVENIAHKIREGTRH